MPDTSRRAGSGSPAQPARGLDWALDRADWPNQQCSRFVEAAGLVWHVQIAGSGPVILLVHGTAASTHSWRDLLPALAEQFTVVAMDLPGHGFTSQPADRELWALPGMAAALAELIETLGLMPEFVVGHSAGAAILVRASLDARINPRRIIGLAPALLPFAGVGRQLFPTLARVLFLNPLVPALFAWRASHAGAVADLLSGTGSSLDGDGVALYRRLMSDRRHCRAALSMMAHWDLEPIEKELGRLAQPLTIIAGVSDRAVPAESLLQVRRLRPATEIEWLRGVGHLAHEQQPALVAGMIATLAANACGLGSSESFGAPTTSDAASGTAASS